MRWLQSIQHHTLLKVASRIGLILIGTLIGILIAEGAARLIWTEPWYEELVTEQMESQRYPYIYNSLGLRDREYSSPKPSETKRILILGDSFTFGMGVGNEDAIFPEILERQLNELPFTQVSVEVLNGGLPGSMTDDWVSLLEELSPSFDPDLVLIVFFLRDGTQTRSIHDYFDTIREEIANQNQLSRLYKYSYIYRLFRDQMDRMAVHNYYGALFNNSYFGDDEQTLEWKQAQSNLIQIQNIAEEQSAKVGLVVFPVLVELNEQYPFQDICDLLVSFGHDIDMPTHNLLPAFIGQSGPKLWVSATDQHPNELGHAIAAESMFPFVVDLLFESEDQD
ncbi:MAG: hypothetical protein GTO18_04695 [Anaerolineales bacterium]|nr:hypothetical protein [Anaerolineales bacterium]